MKPAAASFSDSALVAGLRARDRLSYEFLYRVVRPDVLRYVQRNHGSVADAEDVFQEALLALSEKVHQPGFRLTTSFRTFLLAVVRNLWLNRLRTQRRQGVACDVADLPDLAEEVSDEPSLLSRVRSWLDRATPLCRRLLHALYFANETMDELLPQMGWKNKHTAANQKYKCVQQVKRAAGAG